MADSTDVPDLSYIVEPLRPLAVLIDSVALDPSNAMDHPTENLEAIRGSLAKYGQRKPLVVNRNGNVIEAGNGTWTAAKALGWEFIAAVFVDDDPHTATGYAIADNRTAQLADWFYDRLVVQLQTFDEPAAEVPGVSEEFLEEVMAEAGGGEEPAADPGAQIDRAAELQEKWQVQRGDVWEVGEHRLMCGDSTSAGDVEKLMGGEKADAIVTDPPYGVQYDGGTKSRDKLAGDDSPSLYYPFLVIGREYSGDHVALYLFYADGDAAVTQAVTQAGFTVRNTLIWNKNQAQFGALSAQYKQKHEPFLYCYLSGKSPQWFGPTNEVTVWNIDRAPKNEWHPTQKPPELFARAIRNSTRQGDIVLDGFLGSGTTMVACQQLGRKCRGIELHPPYCAVTLERLSQMGLEPRLAQ